MFNCKITVVFDHGYSLTQLSSPPAVPMYLVSLPYWRATIVTIFLLCFFSPQRYVYLDEKTNKYLLHKCSTLEILHPHFCNVGFLSLNIS